MQPPILPPRTEELLGPLLASLPAASISPQPPTALLPLLSPILRQRVQLLSEATQEPWLPLLCYDTTKISKLETVVKNERLEPHPVSGEVEVDWESEVGIQYKRLDEETLQSLVSIRALDLVVKLIYCINDELGGGDGWRIGEVLTLDSSTETWGYPTIGFAESNFSLSGTQASRTLGLQNGRLPTPVTEKAGEEDEDDDYWAQYDNTPAQTPGPEHKSSSTPAQTLHQNRTGDGTDEDSYYAQYASVQPAMDNHDPEEAAQNGDVEFSLGRDEITSELQNSLSAHDTTYIPPLATTNEMEVDFVAHPRPSSSHGSSGSDTVARLEKAVEEREQEAAGNGKASEVGIKQHIGTSIKSLWRLARVAGIEREDFERVVRTELDVIGMLDEDVD